MYLFYLSFSRYKVTAAVVTEVEHMVMSTLLCILIYIYLKSCSNVHYWLQMMSIIGVFLLIKRNRNRNNWIASQRYVNESVSTIANTYTHIFIHTHIYITVHHVPKCMSCHKGIVEITGRAHCFYDIYIERERAKGMSLLYLNLLFFYFVLVLDIFCF